MQADTNLLFYFRPKVFGVPIFKGMEESFTKQNSVLGNVSSQVGAMGFYHLKTRPVHTNTTTFQSS